MLNFNNLNRSMQTKKSLKLDKLKLKRLFAFLYVRYYERVKALFVFFVHIKHFLRSYL